MPRPNLGAEFSSSAAALASAYGVTPDEMVVRIYSLSEQIHAHCCVTRGLVMHSESRPDQHIAAAILGSLAGGGWWLSKDRPGDDYDMPALGS